MRVISWNVQGRLKALPDQLKALAEHQPDLVALQEVRESTIAPWRDGFQAMGLPFVMESVSLALDQGRKYGVLIASRWPIESLPWMHMPYQERVLSAQIASPSGTLELHNAHVPNGENHGWIKVETFEGIYERLARLSIVPRILCGDFNSPQQEHSDGYLVTWGQDVLPDGRAAVWETWEDKAGRIDTGMRWDRAERLVLTGLAAYDLVDVYRTCNGYEVQCCSWWWVGQDKEIGRRFDHIFAPRSLNMVACEYLEAFRMHNLSDHVPIEARFEPGHVSDA
ncbi:MAG: exodeoxyribonuclease III [Roseiflexaceae bacterium]